ncbi:hypothetical protein [Streptomyces ipomoeae]|uniref:hypothetical protein n=1 Tax=Streptomyces ipomoeae TaxID=103232 RepID=UPI0029B4334E|nr:hypothetical protein [Streptomyces ipomoeae]MDX2692190.1 hypothetical protein [Streptomyces ipomoeae]MDX2839297.1 hypothetical protein [Streptomyces ipomoeae]
MPALKRTAVTLLATAALTSTTLATAGPASAASYVDKRLNVCTKPPAGVTSGCGYAMVIKYWYKKGSKSRGVSWVYTDKGTNSNKTLYARWLYQKPGGKLRVAKSWKKSKDRGPYVSVDWYAGGDHKGPIFPKGTKICTQFKGVTKFCKTLA